MALDLTNFFTQLNALGTLNEQRVAQAMRQQAAEDQARRDHALAMERSEGQARLQAQLQQEAEDRALRQRALVVGLDVAPGEKVDLELLSQRERDYQLDAVRQEVATRLEMENKVKADVARASLMPYADRMEVGPFDPAYLSFFEVDKEGNYINGGPAAAGRQMITQMGDIEAIGQAKRLEKDLATEAKKQEDNYKRALEVSQQAAALGIAVSPEDVTPELAAGVGTGLYSRKLAEEAQADERELTRARSEAEQSAFLKKREQVQAHPRYMEMLTTVPSYNPEDPEKVDMAFRALAKLERDKTLSADLAYGEAIGERIIQLDRLMKNAYTLDMNGNRVADTEAQVELMKERNRLTTELKGSTELLEGSKLASVKYTRQQQMSIAKLTPEQAKAAGVSPERVTQAQEEVNRIDKALGQDPTFDLSKPKPAKPKPDKPRTTVDELDELKVELGKTLQEEEQLRQQLRTLAAQRERERGAALNPLFEIGMDTLEGLRNITLAVTGGDEIDSLSGVGARFFGGSGDGRPLGQPAPGVLQEVSRRAYNLAPNLARATESLVLSPVDETKQDIARSKQNIERLKAALGLEGPTGSPAPARSPAKRQKRN